MNLAALVQAMADEGLSAQEIARVVARMEESRKEKSRAGNAERQRRFKAKRNNANNANNADNNDNGVTDVISVTESAGTELAHARVNPDPSLRSGSIVTPLPSVGPQAEKPKRVSGSALPQDWTPPEDLFAYGATLGLSRDQSAEILERMRLWAVGNKNRAVARKADWTSTMQGALRRDAAKFQARAGPARADPRDGLATVFRETLARVRDDERRQNETCGDGDVRSLPVVSAQPRADGFDVGGLLGGLKRFP